MPDRQEGAVLSKPTVHRRNSLGATDLCPTSAQVQRTPAGSQSSLIRSSLAKTRRASTRDRAPWPTVFSHQSTTGPLEHRLTLLLRTFLYCIQIHCAAQTHPSTSHITRILLTTRTHKSNNRQQEATRHLSYQLSSTRTPLKLHPPLIAAISLQTLLSTSAPPKWRT